MDLSGFIVALLIGVVIMSVVVAVHDFRTRRIPNQILLISIGYALLVFTAMAFFAPITQVLKGLLFSLLGVALGGLFLYPSYRLKQVGAGDVKLMMVYGLFLGPKGVILALIYGAMVGGIWALGLAWKIGGLGHLWHNLKFMARSAYLSGFKDMGWDLRSEGAIAMPYGVALSVGAVLVTLWQFKIHIGRLMGVSE